MSEWTVDTLKELIEQRLCALEAARTRDKESFTAHVASTAKALELAAGELSRRLHDLNGEQARIAQSQATYVSREIWQRSQEETQRFREEYQIWRRDIEGRMSTQTGRSAGLHLSLSMIGAMVLGTAAIAGTIATIIGTIVK